LESSVCDLSRRLIDLTSGSTSLKRNCSLNSFNIWDGL
jgi:hypothetical protein